jgi:hypothetical protein
MYPKGGSLPSGTDSAVIKPFSGLLLGARGLFIDPDKSKKLTHFL